MSTKKFESFKKSFSEVYSNTGRLLFEFSRLQYTLAAPEVFVALANPVSLPPRYRVGIVRSTNIHTPTVLLVPGVHIAKAEDQGVYNSPHR